MIGDRDFAPIVNRLNRLQKELGIKEKCALLNIVKYKIQLSSKDFQPKLPEWPKGRIFQIDTQEQWEAVVPQIISHQREIIGKFMSCSHCAMLHI